MTVSDNEKSKRCRHGDCAAEYNQQCLWGLDVHLSSCAKGSVNLQMTLKAFVDFLKIEKGFIIGIVGKSGFPDHLPVDLFEKPMMIDIS